MLEFSRERTSGVYVYMYMCEIYYKEYAPAIIKATVPISAVGKVETRGAGGVILD